LYLLDLGTDVYVAIQHKKNGDIWHFRLTACFIGASIIIVNIFATIALKAPWYIRTLAFLTHSSMILLFVSEIRRWKKEGCVSNTHPCNSGKHFSECDCNGCDVQLKKSVKASLNMSHVRSMETFIEAVPQWLLQVYIMIYEQSFPWYTILSVVVSFISLVFCIFALEKNYWIRKIVQGGQDYIRPVSFPKSSAVIFFFWQTFLLFGRLSAIILNSIVFKDSIFDFIIAHWIVVVLALICSIKTPCDEDAHGGFICRIRSRRHLIISFLSLFIIYPLLFHVSHSSVACMKNFLPNKNIISTQIEDIMALIIPMLFAVSHAISCLLAIKNNGKEELLVWYIAVGSLYVLAFFFEVMFYSCYHPLKVTYRNWQKLKDQADVRRGTMNI
jgi:hypothetical protein